MNQAKIKKVYHYLSMITHKQQLVIVSGARQGIGKSFLDHYLSIPDTQCRGLSRTQDSRYLQLDLLDETATSRAVDSLDCNGIERIVYLHAVGMDKFEPKGVPHIDNDGDGIDDNIYNSNVGAFVNIAHPLIEKSTSLKIPLLLANVGSISDIYVVPFWQSFSKAKNRVRQYVKSINNPFVRGIFLNVGSTLDEEGIYRYGRVKADTTYWQTSKELVQKSTPFIDEVMDGPVQFTEFDFYKYNPHFRADYFTNLPKLYFTWQRDMGFEGKEVPSGIRI